MKCPKCGYLGFETVDQCRNCGYDFSLSSPAAAPLDPILDPELEHPLAATLDLDRIIGGPEPAAALTDLPLFSPPQEEAGHRPASAIRGGLPGRGRGIGLDDAPLITVPSRPRTPLGVRRATPEVPRARPRSSRPRAGDDLFDGPPVVVRRHVSQIVAAHDSGEPLATPSSRLIAALVDAALMLALDAVVVYFTLRLCGLAPSQFSSLPLLPLVAFLLLLNGGYFIAFTAVGGQSIGKMAVGIKVVAQEEGAVPIGRATVRTLAYLASALPLGAGFLPGMIRADRLTLHDRLAHTRVVRPTSA